MSAEIAIAKKRVRRSEKLPPELLQAFIEKVESFDTKEDAVEYFGLSRVVLNNTMGRGSAAPRTVAIIRNKINVAA